jgi:hypothetical protein
MSKRQREQPAAVEGPRELGRLETPEGLARALAAWLEKTPALHPDRTPAEERRGQASWLGLSVWAPSPPGSGKPTADDVLEALGEIRRYGRRRAA